MMAVVRVLLLVLGIIAVIFGAAMYIENQNFLGRCPGAWPTPMHEENCRVAGNNVIFGLLFMVIGTVFIIVGIISFILARRNRMKDRQNCPKCRNTITRQSSPKNCYNCGMPIDWSKAKGKPK